MKKNNLVKYDIYVIIWLKLTIHLNSIERFVTFISTEIHLFYWLGFGITHLYEFTRIVDQQNWH